MKKQPYQRAFDLLKSKGLDIGTYKKKFSGLSVEAFYPMGDKKVEIHLSYSSFLGSTRAEFFIPYSPLPGPLMEAYDRVFPEEKNAWGRSSPKFEQAIVDYMRGQAHSSTVVELRDHKKLLYIAFSVPVNGRKEEGFIESIGKISFEMRKGMIHGDVLFHMFAY